MEERNGVRFGRENGSQCGAGLSMYCRAVLRVYYFYELFEIVSTRRCSLLHKHRGYAVLIDCLVARYGKKSTMESATYDVLYFDIEFGVGDPDLNLIFLENGS